MSDRVISNIEDMNKRELVELLMDMIHRFSVHQTLWFYETEKELGYEKALEVMDYAWEKTKDSTLKRFSKDFGFEMDDKLPEPLLQMGEDELMNLMSSIGKDWLAQDGVFFQGIEFTNGMKDAKTVNDNTWSKFSPYEANAIRKLIGLEENCGLEGLQKALNFRMYGSINKQNSYFEDGALYFEMNDCRVQSARKRKGLQDYPCKSAGLVEYSSFAKEIDSRIKMECICCPPDDHPDTCFCKWKFFI